MPSLYIKGNRFIALSKGKEICGEFSQSALDAIMVANPEDLKRPFYNFTDNAIKKRIIYHTKKLRREGKITESYSCHDFRHYFAVMEYRKYKDVHRLSKLLHYASIQVTESYLKSLGEYDV